MKKLMVVLGIIVFCGCGEKLMSPPENLIPKEKMIEILEELTIINSAKKTNAGVLHENNIEPTELVFTKYGIDSLQFVTSDRYYASMPGVYESMYIEIEVQLDTLKGKVTRAKHLSDSLELQKKIKKSITKEKPSKKDVSVLQ